MGKNGRWLNFFVEKNRITTSKKGRWPQFFLKNNKDDLKKMEDNPKTKIKMEDDVQKKGRRPKKNEDKPINQNQPNWLWHHCKFT